MENEKQNTDTVEWDFRLFKSFVLCHGVTRKRDGWVLIKFLIATIPSSSHYDYFVATSVNYDDRSTLPIFKCNVLSVLLRLSNSFDISLPDPESRPFSSPTPWISHETRSPANKTVETVKFLQFYDAQCLAMRLTRMLEINRINRRGKNELI